MVHRLEVSGLDADVLRSLYIDHLLTETQIAQKFGVTQVQIGRMRRRWGIPTLSLGDRVAAKLPSQLTDQQHQLLIGSLLGDGWMRATSAHSASFCEGHSLKQEAYSRWKASLLGEFVSSIYPTEKRKGDKSYKALYFSTHACAIFRHYYDLFYPAPDRKRVFPETLSELMTPFSLAVWYMDDGGVTQRGEPRIAFGLDDLSRSRACKAMARLGLKPKVYGEDGDQGIHFPKQAMLFRSLVEPHIPTCMSYKMPFESKGQEQHRIARDCSPDRARALYEGGLSVQQIGEMYGVGASTINRRLLEANTPKRTSGPRKAMYTVEGAREILTAYTRTSAQWEELPSATQDTLVDEVFGILRRAPFPISLPFDKEAAQLVFGQVQQAAMLLADNRIQPIRKVGIACCASFFPNRYSAHSRGVKTAFESWHQDKDLKRAIRFQFEVGDPVVPHRVLRAITMQCRTPTVFRPTVARFLYERYCPKGGLVWDPCSGYGGRLMGALAAGVRYVGTDVDAETVEGNRQLAKVLGLEADVQLCPAETFTPPPVDMVFTSPPYFNREVYSHGDQQSWRLGTFDSWVDGFLRPILQKTMMALRTGGHLVLNVADVRDKGTSIPLSAKAREIAGAEGFRFVEQLGLPLPKLNRVDPFEPILVFTK